MFKVVCMDDKNMPEGIKESNWIKKGKTYTVIDIITMRMMNNRLAFVLEEVKPDSPFVGYLSDRFGIPEDEIERIQEEYNNMATIN